MCSELSALRTEILYYLRERVLLCCWALRLGDEGWGVRAEEGWKLGRKLGTQGGEYAAAFFGLKSEKWQWGAQENTLVLSPEVHHRGKDKKEAKSTLHGDVNKIIRRINGFHKALDNKISADPKLSPGPQRHPEPSDSQQDQHKGLECPRY